MTKLTKAEQEVNIVKYADETEYCDVLYRPCGTPTLPPSGRESRWESHTAPRRHENLFASRLSLAPGEKKAEPEPGAESRTRRTYEGVQRHL